MAYQEAMMNMARLNRTGTHTHTHTHTVPEYTLPSPIFAKEQFLIRHSLSELKIQSNYNPFPLYCLCLLCVSLAAGLMHTFNAHAATDITGFGILGHAQTLARQQRSEVSFVIHNLPVLAKMAAVSKACGNMFGLMHGTCPETSGACVSLHLCLSHTHTDTILPLKIQTCHPQKQYAHTHGLT